MKRMPAKILCTLIFTIGILLVFAVFANAAVYGDVLEDESNTVTAADARLILRFSVGLEEFTDEQKLYADIDENGSITAADARSALRMSVGLDEIKHYYTKTLIKEPTCTENGEMEFACTECEDVYTEPVEALGHNYPDPEILIQVTCEQDGLERYTCERCGNVEEITVPGGHVWNVEEATCTEDKQCTRCLLIDEEKLGHTTDWGKCETCKVFVTDKHAEAAATVKENYIKATEDVTTAYGYIQESIGAYSWLKGKTSNSKPYYVSAKEAYKAAYDACGDIPELQSIKEKLGKILTNLDGILEQVEVILAYDKYIGDDATYFMLVGPIDDLNYINNDSVDTINSSLKKEILW